MLDQLHEEMVLAKTAWHSPTEEDETTEEEEEEEEQGGKEEG